MISKKNELVYPIEKGFKVHGEFTCNFSADENFVVFECVNRLFEKGYKPEHIELEPKWKVGHGASGGRADILIKDNSGKSLLIIECKKDESEFKKEWNNTLQRGGQMLTYAKQAGTTQYVCLYVSDFVDDKVSSKSHIISLKDNEKLLEELADKKPLSFKEAKALEVEDIYKAWRETYNLDFSTKGIFEDDILPYQIGKQKYATKDLLEVSSKDIQSKYHEFATILRQHNVSGRENAFDKLVNLFLCKIVDESKNPEDLKFNWKGIAYDSYFDLQDRLQLLYQAGMKEFLAEDVTYIDGAAIDKAFRFFKKDPDATKDTIKKYFRQLKFFTNNDFAFIDVHNEKLFYQNSEVLLKIVQMLQDIRLQSENQNQFLGDMFEGFLDNGVKQSEGQFFTPMPIVKFILNSLPLESLIQESELPPKALDYACGAGHFLNELALQIKPFVQKHKKADITEYYKEIVGVEKDYRLSKVAKVSAFMYGQDEIKITYADALGNKAKLQENEYSILVANPPYAVEGFLQTLSEIERKSFTLFNWLDEKSLSNNNSIETFFIERAKQLLKPNAVAGIILPSSILSNQPAIYTKTREIILKYFQIIAIAEFGSQTFGKTGTNTVTLFLRRKEENPAPAEHFKNRVDSWFDSNQNDEIYNDQNLINSYCSHIEIEAAHYKTLLAGNPSDELLKTEMFVDYKKSFENLTEIKNLKKPNNFFSKKPKAEQENELNRRFTEYLREIEKDKIYFFVLALENKQKVLVVKCPSDNKEQKQFLGYEWSSAKGNEGIKYINQSSVAAEIEDAETKELVQKISGLHNINTPLYNPNNRNDQSKINHYIQESFLGNELAVAAGLQPFIAYHNLADMLDFSRVNFNKQIQLNSKKLTAIQSKWELVRLGEVAAVFKGKTITEKDSKEGSIKVVAGGLNFAYLHNISNRTANIITVSASGANAGFVNFWKEEIFASDCTTIQGKSLEETLYFFSILKYLEGDIYAMARGAAQPHVYPNDLKSFKIPLPPKEIQQKIVDECAAIDNQAQKAAAEIEKAKTEIEDMLKKVLNENFRQEKISNISTVNPSKSEIKSVEDATLVSFVEMASVSEKGAIINKVDKSLSDLRKGSYTYFRDNDIIIAKITPCMENGKCALAKDLKNGIGMGSSEFHVIRTSEILNSKFLFSLLNRKEVRKEAEKNMTGSSGHRRVPASYYENLKIPVPPISEQEKLVNQIEKLEQIIAKNQAKIDDAPNDKKAIMKNYL